MTSKTGRWRRPMVLCTIAVTALVAAACGGGTKEGPTPTGSTGGTSAASPRPSSPAIVKIVSPTNGEQFRSGQAIPVNIDLTGAKIVKASTTHITPTTGHLHLSVDDTVVSMNYQTTNTLKGVKPGMHVLKVEFVAADHLPFDPRVIQAVTFEVTK